MMTLKEYKEKYNLKSVQLARMFKASQSCIHHWINGYAKPNLHHAAMIYKKTKGEVTLEDLGVV